MIAADESTLVIQSQNGDQVAFETLVREHQRMIDSLCYRMTGSLDDAKDLTQETFIQAHRHLASFRAKARFSSWLYRIAMNQCLNWQKNRLRQQRLQKQWSEQSAAIEQSGAAVQDLSEAIQSALLRLAPKQRAAVVLTVYDGLNHAEAAKILGCSETTVSWRLFAARTKLRRLLSGLARAHTQA